MADYLRNGTFKNKQLQPWTVDDKAFIRINPPYNADEDCSIRINPTGTIRQECKGVSKQPFTLEFEARAVDIGPEMFHTLFAIVTFSIIVDDQYIGAKLLPILGDAGSEWRKFSASTIGDGKLEVGSLTVSVIGIANYQSDKNSKTAKQEELPLGPIEFRDFKLTTP